MMELIEVALPLGLGVTLAATAGLRAFLPLLLVSALGYTGAVELTGPVAFLGHPAAVLTFTTGVLFEVAADKVPFVDHFVDMVGTVVRPLAGALVGTSLVAGTEPLVTAVMGMAAGGTVAGLAHVGKATVRASSTAATGGTGSPILSTIEDVIAVGIGGAAALAAAGAL
ncbi:MAG: DUF4126 domain-containing protein [Myxococcota bacterium]|nr:DUF4126 domain-containing protein [Myxococcota bacterium]MEC8425715.1 DUF4126 domain-containing protein [Myxococcota bacterium]